MWKWLKKNGCMGFALGVAWLSGCTNVDVDAIIPYHNDKLSLDGEFCTTDPADVIYSTRVLFLIDCSDSMQWNDPNYSRADAIQSIMDMYKDVDAVSFGIIRFGETVEVETDAFTKNPEELRNALLPIKGEDPDDPEKKKQYLGGTDYIKVLGKALEFVVRDRVTNYQKRDQVYIAVFITDGAPQAGDFDPSATVLQILDLVRSLHEMNVTLHTVMMSAEMQGVPLEFLDILQNMAVEGGGEYRQLKGSNTIQAILGDLLDLTGVLRVFDLKEFVVYNLNTVLAEFNGSLDSYADSDGDGLADFQEIALGTSPVLEDTDGDCLSDMVEVHTGGDPLAKEMHGLDCSSPDFADDDQDGLNNWEEDLLGTDKSHFDTDMDGLPDGLEERSNTNPLVGDERGDYDGDFYPNLDEVRGHTNPRMDEGDLQPELGYQYSITKIGRNRGRFCYHFRVDNITLRTPQAALGKNVGLNRIRIVVMDSPTDNPYLVGNMIQMDAEIVYREPNFRDPNALTMFVDPEGFQ